jgi:hypothetical protein
LAASDQVEQLGVSVVHIYIELRRTGCSRAEQITLSLRGPFSPKAETKHQI